MQKNDPWVQALLSACVILIAGLLIYGCLFHIISYDGTQDMYSFSSVRAHFTSFGWAYAGLTAGAAVCSVLAKKPFEEYGKAQEYRRKKAMTMRTKRFLRIGFLGLSAVLIALGIVNGGLYDVFVKAVNICTECIGLG